MKMVQKGLQLIAVSACLFTSQLFAQDSHADFASAAKLSFDDCVRAGWHEATVGGGFSMTCITGKDRPIVNYAMAYAETGYFLYDVKGHSFFRGNLEVLLEAFGAGIYESRSAGGNYIAGGTLYLRYNFVPDGWRVIPYVEGGAGLTSMDIKHIYDGMDFNFNLDLGAGLRCFVSHRCAVNLECLFQHISNADLGDHNIGLNTLGPRLGISFFF